jgi:hypothetical protein
MRTIDDPELTDDEYGAICELLVPLTDELMRRFGRVRTEVILKNWHVADIAGDLGNRSWAPDQFHRTLGNLNEEYRHEQFVDHMTAGGAEETFRPLVLIPTREP